MLYGSKIIICSEIHTKHMNALCGQTVQLYKWTPFTRIEKDNMIGKDKRITLRNVHRSLYFDIVNQRNALINERHKIIYLTPQSQRAAHTGILMPACRSNKQTDKQVFSSHKQAAYSNLKTPRPFI
jgi:hypothetical protein